MGIRMIESFDYLGNNNSTIDTQLAGSRWVGGTWTQASTVSSRTDFMTDGRMCMHLGGAGQPIWHDNTGHEKWIVAHDINISVSQAATGELFTIGWDDGADFSELIRVDRTTGGAIEVYTGTDLHGTTTDGVLAMESGNFFELQAIIATATGSVELWVDADKLITATDVDTKGTTTATHFNEWRAVPGNKQFSNMRIWDGAGTDFNEAVGKVTHNTTVLVATLGVLNDWTTTTTATNYELVDDTTFHDSDTTYLEAGTASQSQSVAISPIPANRIEIHGVQVTAVARRTAGGDADIKMMCISNGVTATGGDLAPGGQRNLSSNYWFINEIFETDPDTGTAWTASAARDYEPAWKYATATA